jgi:hypothetical protein
MYGRKLTRTRTAISTATISSIAAVSRSGDIWTACDCKATAASSPRRSISGTWSARSCYAGRPPFCSGGARRGRHRRCECKDHMLERVRVGPVAIVVPAISWAHPHQKEGAAIPCTGPLSASPVHATWYQRRSPPRAVPNASAERHRQGQH